MKNTSSSNRYSDAIFEIASQDDNLSGWGDFLNELSEIFKDRKIQKFFLDPKINNNDKVALISESNIQTDQKKINFLKLMIEKKVMYDHTIDKKKNKWKEGKRLKTSKLTEMPDYINENISKYVNWLDLNKGQV